MSTWTKHILEFIEKISILTYAHKDQIRKSGEAYIVHPIQVAGILAELKVRSRHDCDWVSSWCRQDTGFSIDDIEYEFGKDVHFSLKV